MEPIQVKWRVIAQGASGAIEQRTIVATYAANEDEPALETEPLKPPEFNVIALSPNQARKVAADILRLLRRDRRCTVELLRR